MAKWPEIFLPALRIIVCRSDGGLNKANTVFYGEKACISIEPTYEGARRINRVWQFDELV